MASTNIFISGTSRYKATPLLRRPTTGALEWGMWVSTPAIRNAEFMLHQISEKDVGRLDLLAYYYYGNAGYGWFIADANGIIDQIQDMKLGGFIKIPDQSVIEAYVQRSRAS